MCEDCPIYEGYPTSVLGWDDDDSLEGICPDCGLMPDACTCDEEPCQWCESVGCHDGVRSMDGGFVKVLCGCECHEGDESEEGLRGMTEETVGASGGRPRLANLPPRGQGGADWYHTRRDLEWHCPQCGERHDQQASVLEYLPDQDTGGLQRKRHGGWGITGWAAWWQCPTCSYDRVRAIDRSTVAEFGRRCGGWLRGSEGTQP